MEYFSKEDIESAIENGYAGKFNKDGVTMLMSAIKLNDEKLIEELLKGGARLNKSADTRGRTPLIYAAVYGDAETIKALVEAGADLNQDNPGGRTPLMEAATHGNTKTIKALVEAGADVDKVDKNGKTSLMEAAAHGNVEAIKALAAAGADVDKVDKNGKTPLMEAATHDNVEAIKALAAAGADVNKVDKDGVTMLVNAIYGGQVEIVKALAAAGADVNKAIDNKNSPLNGKTPIMFLKEVNEFFEANRTELIQENVKEVEDMFNILIVNGADYELIVNGADYDGDKFPETVEAARDARKLLIGEMKVEDLKGRSEDKIEKIKSSMLDFADEEKARDLRYEITAHQKEEKLNSLVPTLLYESGIISSTADDQLLGPYSTKSGEEYGKATQEHAAKAKKFFENNPKYQPKNFIRDVLLNTKELEEFKKKILTSARSAINLEFIFEELEPIIKLVFKAYLPHQEERDINTSYSEILGGILESAKIGETKEEERAATKIQKSYRGKLERKRGKISELKNEKEEQKKSAIEDEEKTAAAIDIQRVARGRLAREKLRNNQKNEKGTSWEKRISSGGSSKPSKGRE